MFKGYFLSNIFITNHVYKYIFKQEKKYISTLLPEEIQAVASSMSNMGDQYEIFKIIYNSVIEKEVIAAGLKES